MGWHIHTRDGKFNIWSTVVDGYILEDWVSEDEVKKAYVGFRVEDARKEAGVTAERMVTRAKGTGFCGSLLRCDPQRFWRRFSN